MNPFLLCDYYKLHHINQYPPGTEYVYSNLTPRKSRIPSTNEVVFFGLQHFIKKYLIGYFNEHFFNREKDTVVQEYLDFCKNTNTGIVSADHIGELHDLGYLPLAIKALPEGTSVPIGVPVLTIINTDPRFYWITNFIETLLSAELWQCMTSATISREYRRILEFYSSKEDKDFVKWQGHDFSFRGMSSLESAINSGMGHLLYFYGTDTIPAILEISKYYNSDLENELIGGSVPATEHSVMCSYTKLSEKETIRRLITEIYPNGIVSVVSDTWDFWKVMTEYLPELKDEILKRDGKLVIRPDSGDPADILCGLNTGDDDVELSDYNVASYEEFIHLPQYKGAVELLWETFGGTTNSLGQKVLDPHVGLIYGDSITLERAAEICHRLHSKGFASTNVVFGIGSFTYQYNTRDTFGFAMKATAVIINGNIIEIYKDPVTDDGTKRSAKGFIRVDYDDSGKITLYDSQNIYEENLGLLRIVFHNGKMYGEVTFSEIRNIAETSL